ncbi:SafA/ExsA family spore coat assembly protein [Bacillus toyonensis]
MQKGDTLWKIAKKYGVDFDTLKKTNTQLSNPDLIMPGMKIKVPSNGVHVKHQVGAGSAPPKQYVKEVQQKEFAATPTPLGIEDEEEVTYQSAPITQQPAMQQTQKEVQVKPQKEVQVKPQKEVQKEQPIQKEKPVEKPSVIQKPPVIEKQKPAEKENTKFSINVLPQPPQPPQPPIKTKKEYKISDVIKKGSELIAPQITKMKPNNVISPQTKKDNIVSPQVKKENVGNIVSPQVKKANMMPIMDNNQMPNMMPIMDNNQPPNMMPYQMPYQQPMMPPNPYYQQQNPYYNMPYQQGAPFGPQYTSMPNPNMMPMDNNMPPLIQGEEDCGCGGESRLYSPQPGGPQYANPLYYQPTQSAYAPQPGTMYYQPDPPNVFGEPVAEEEDDEEV